MTPHSIETRCDIHARKMNDEGWYVTANVLTVAAQEIRNLRDRLSAYEQVPEPTENNCTYSEAEIARSQANIASILGPDEIRKLEEEAIG